MLAKGWKLKQPSSGLYMAGCQNYGPFLGTLNIRGRIVIGTQKGTIILITTHIHPSKFNRVFFVCASLVFLL